MNYRIYQIQFIDKVFWFDTIQDFPASGTKDRIYADKSENALYQWKNGSYVAFSETSASPSEISVSISDILSNQSAYFTCSGLGTEASPYVITPKLGVSHRNSVYEINASSAPSTNTYMKIKSSGNEKCNVRINSTLAGQATKFIFNLYNLDDYVRPRNKLNAGVLTSSDMDSSTNNIAIFTDLNDSGIFTTYSL